jgi:hypothetical protein
MTKYLPEQTRVYGTTIYLQTGHNFEETAAILSALDGAGITYEDQVYDSSTGDATGRVKVFGTEGTRILLVINGMAVSHIYANVFFTPTASELSAIQNSNLGYEYEYGPIAETAAEIGDQIFPTPAFDDETGVISLAGGNGWTISGGTMSCDDDASATFEPLKDIVEGVYAVEIIETALTHRGVNVDIGTGNVQAITWGAGTTGTCTIPVGADPDQVITIYGGDGVPVSLTACTVTRTS